MFATLKTLVAGSSARANERLRDHYSLELIDQKIREAQGALKAAKLTLASLIQRQRAENRQLDLLQSRIRDLEARVKEALGGKREDLAEEAARAIAGMENERMIRRETLSRLETRIMRLRHCVEATNRRIIDLKQGAIAARAIRSEQDIQKRIGKTFAGESPITEAEELIARVLERDDPFEQREILIEIDEGLNGSSISEKLAAEGFGPSEKVTAEDVLQRLKAGK